MKSMYCITIIAACMFLMNAGTTSGTGTGGTISGTVTESESTAPVAGVKIYLRTTDYGEYIDSATTSADGTYSIDNVQPDKVFTLVTSADGYGTVRQNIIADAEKPLVCDFQLETAVECTVRGTITSDSTGAALANVKVTISIDGFALDSTTTGADGWYEISDVQITTPFAVSAKLTGYYVKTTKIVETTGVETVNMALSEIPSGTLIVAVLKEEDSTTIAGASATAKRLGLNDLLGTTGSTGYTIFKNISIGTYGISVYAGGYTIGSDSQIVALDAIDTVRIFMTVSPNGTKTLTGVVTDSISGAPLANVRVLLILGDIEQTPKFLLDSTDTAGTYWIEGIPVNYPVGMVTTTLPGYKNGRISEQILGDGGMADTTIANITLSAYRTSLSSVTLFTNKKTAVSIAGNRIRLHNVDENSTISIFSAKGRLVYRTNITAYTKTVVLPELKVAAGLYFLNLSQKNTVISKEFILPYWR